MVSMRPMMNRQNRESGIEGAIVKRQAVSARLYSVRRRPGALPNHFCRGLDGDHEATAWLIRAGARAYVQNTSGPFQCAVDSPGDSFIRSTVLRVADADAIVQRLAHEI
jgi:hypothetical protein